LALLHYLLSPDIYPEQFLTSGMFFWLMVWRVLNARGRGADVTALAVLAVASGLFTALLEAGWVWAYHGYEPLGTLRNDFSLDLGIPPAWQVLALGLLAAAAAFVRQALLPGAAGLDARKIG
jgi:sulfoxide reductase heme-binding subunit YedZ